MTSRPDFLKGKVIIEEFTLDGHEYIVYKLSPYTTNLFVTGTRFEWQFGLRWEPAIKRLVIDYVLTEDEVRKLTILTQKP